MRRDVFLESRLRFDFHFSGIRFGDDVSEPRVGWDTFRLRNEADWTRAERGRGLGFDGFPEVWAFIQRCGGGRPAE